MSNLQADDQGKAHYEPTVNNVSILGSKNPILGRAVIVHAKVDDGGQPVGNAGARIACGVIGLGQPRQVGRGGGRPRGSAAPIDSTSDPAHQQDSGTIIYARGDQIGGDGLAKPTAPSMSATSH